MKFTLGNKLEMTQVFQPDGTVVPVTKVQAGPCLILQKKHNDKDGYTAIKCAFQDKKKANKALTGIFNKFGKKKYQFVKEIRLADSDSMLEKLNEGDVITAGIFTNEDEVSIIGTSKGKGFQGVVKRYGFKGGKASHGHKDQLRMPGSIGATGPARVFKGTRMGGRTGGDQITVTGLQVIDVDIENNILYIKGAVPGARNGFLVLTAQGEFELTKQAEPVEEKKEEVKKEEPKVEEKKQEVKSEESKVEEKKEEATVEQVKKEEPKEDKKEEDKK